MLHHASRLATTSSLPLSSILQAAAGRAWTRRAVHNMGTVSPEVMTSVRGSHEARSWRVVPRNDALPESSTAPARHSQLRRSQRFEELDESSLAMEQREQRLPEAHPFSSETSTSVLQQSVPIYRRRNSRPPPGIVVSCSEVLDYLTPTDPYSTDIGLEPLPSLQTDPPWRDIASSMSDYNTPLARVHYNEAGRALNRALPVAIPAPQSAQTLLRNMKRLVKLTPPPSLKQIVAYHASFHAFNSVKTYNFLLSMAIRFASFGTVNQLLDSMQMQQIDGNMETRRLTVRSMVRRGLWHRAWHQETEREGGRALPLSIWLIFFETAKRGATSTRIWKHGRRHALDLPEYEVQDFSQAESDPSRVRVLMQHPPQLLTEQLAMVAPRPIYLLADAFIRTGQRELAVSVTSKYFQGLPKELNDEWRSQCLDIIHRHLKSDRRSKAHFRKQRLLAKFLGMHPSFRPTPTTLFYLLQDLRRTQKCYDYARDLVVAYTTRWGEGVIDDRVRRRLASLAVKQGLDHRASLLEGYQDLVEGSRREYRVMQEVTDVDNGESVGCSKDIPTPSLVSAYSRRKLEGWRWWLLRRRLWRLRSLKAMKRRRLRRRVRPTTDG